MKETYSKALIRSYKYNISCKVKLIITKEFCYGKSKLVDTFRFHWKHWGATHVMLNCRSEFVGKRYHAHTFLERSIWEMVLNWSLSFLFHYCEYLVKFTEKWMFSFFFPLLFSYLCSFSVNWLTPHFYWIYGSEPFPFPSWASEVLWMLLYQNHSNSCLFLHLMLNYRFFHGYPWP
jgi:hypothetical protein